MNIKVGIAIQAVQNAPELFGNVDSSLANWDKLVDGFCYVHADICHFISVHVE